MISHDWTARARPSIEDVGAMDATAWDTTASAHFQSRAGRHGKCEVSTIVLCGSLAAVEPVLDWDQATTRVRRKKL